MPSSPKRISAIVLSYNHEAYISECLESILNQKVGAEFEIIVADDASTDDTLKKVNTYQKRHPGKIILLGNKTNLGHTRNYFRAWQHATGDFIAHCDGDDFWNTPLKLAEQLDFLETHPSFSTCAHKVNVLNESGYAPWVLPTDSISVVTTTDLLKACYPHNSSLFFRNRLFTEFPDFFYALTGHDWCISILNSLRGPIQILDNPMATWRVRTNGLWGGRKECFHLEHTRLFLEKMENFLPSSFKNTITHHQARNFLQLSEAYLRENNRLKARAHLQSALKLRRLGAFPRRAFFSLVARLQFPKEYERIKQLRNFVFGEPTPQ